MNKRDWVFLSAVISVMIMAIAFVQYSYDQSIVTAPRVIRDQTAEAVPIVQPSSSDEWDEAALESHYGAQLDFNLGDVKDDISAEDRLECLRLLATIDQQLELRDKRQLIKFGKREQQARERFNEILDDLTSLYYSEPDWDDSADEVVETSARTRILASLKEVMAQADYDEFESGFEAYLDEMKDDQYMALFDNLYRYPELNADLIVLLLDQYGTEQINGLYAIDDQLNLKAQPIVAGASAVVSGQLAESTGAQLWQLIEKIIPEQDLRYFDYLLISSDGVYNNLASVLPSPNDDGSGERWLIQVDDADLDEELIATIIHEYAHYLTLNDRQVKYIDKFQVDRYCEDGMIANTDAILSDFYRRFWRDYIIDDYVETSYYFYLRNQTAFVTDYAATNASEDIAESFSYYVLRDKPTGDTIADQKLLFFYQYPELVELRDAIRRQLDL